MKLLMENWKKYLIEGEGSSFTGLFTDDELMDIVDIAGGHEILHFMKRHLYEEDFEVEEPQRRGVIDGKPKLSGTRWNFRKGPVWIQIRLLPEMDDSEKEISIYYKDPEADGVQQLGGSTGSSQFNLQWPNGVTDELKRIISQMRDRQ